MEKIEFTVDGIKYCGICKHPKQFIKIADGIIKTFPMRCECEERAYKEQRLAEEKEQREFALKMRAAKLRADGIQIKQYHDYTLANDDNKTPQLTAKIKKYINGFAKYKAEGKGLMLYGSVGTGKTFYAMCIANALIDKGYKVYSTSLSQITRYLSEYGKADSRFKALMSYDLIVLDDLGTESNTSKTMEIIQDVIDGCSARRIPIVVTTNLTPEIFRKAREGNGTLEAARISSRILERVYPLKINAVKRRDINAKKSLEDMEKDFE